MKPCSHVFIAHGNILVCSLVLPNQLNKRTARRTDFTHCSFGSEPNTFMFIICSWLISRLFPAQCSSIARVQLSIQSSREFPASPHPPRLLGARSCPLITREDDDGPRGGIKGNIYPMSVEFHWSATKKKSLRCGSIEAGRGSRGSA